MSASLPTTDRHATSAWMTPPSVPRNTSVIWPVAAVPLPVPRAFKANVMSPPIAGAMSAAPVTNTTKQFVLTSSSGRTTPSKRRGGLADLVALGRQVGRLRLLLRLLRHLLEELLPGGRVDLAVGRQAARALERADGLLGLRPEVAVHRGGEARGAQMLLGPQHQVAAVAALDRDERARGRRAAERRERLADRRPLGVLGLLPRPPRVAA